MERGGWKEDATSFKRSSHYRARAAASVYKTPVCLFPSAIRASSRGDVQEVEGAAGYIRVEGGIECERFLRGCYEEGVGGRQGVKKGSVEE